MKDLESKSLSKQIKRYAQVGGVVGKLATKLATQKYLGVKIDKKKHAEEIRAALGGIKGPLMKVAQLSATIRINWQIRQAIYIKRSQRD